MATWNSLGAWLGQHGKHRGRRLERNDRGRRRQGLVLEALEARFQLGDALFGPMVSAALLRANALAVPGLANSGGATRKAALWQDPTSDFLPDASAALPDSTGTAIPTDRQPTTIPEVVRQVPSWESSGVSSRPTFSVVPPVVVPAGNGFLDGAASGLTVAQMAGVVQSAAEAGAGERNLLLAAGTRTNTVRASDAGIGVQSSGVHAQFNLSHPTTGPFPSNVFTVPDGTHNTGRRVSLPLPDCKVHVSDCEDLTVINELDGFNLQPRLSVPFDGPIDVNSVSSTTMFLVSLGSTLDEGWMPRGTVVGINQIVWDVATTTLHVESDELLAQHTRFALLVTRGVLDGAGDPVEATKAFRNFRDELQGDLKFYRDELLDALAAAEELGVPEKEIVTASVFTTQSATAVLEKIRDQIGAGTPKPADFLLGPKGERTVFPLNAGTSITWRQQTQVDPPAFNPVNLNLNLLRDIYPDVVGGLAFGKFLAPDYQVHPGEYIPPVGTRTGTPEVQGVNEVYFNLVLPSGPMPKGGWPVTIFGQGNTGNKNESMLAVVASMAAQGVATIAINTVGHGFGPLGTLTVSQPGGEPLTFSAGGRGIDQNKDNMIGNNEGLSTASPRGVIFFSDGIRQTAVDTMQLVRVIQVGMDVDGDGQRDLDSSRVYYSGNSLGGNVGAVFLAVEPGVLAGTITVPGNPPANRLYGGRPVLGGQLDARQPSLLNAPGITVFGGRAVNAPYFHENLPLRDGVPLAVTLADGSTQVIQSPVTNAVAGAAAIQQVVEHTDWVSQAGNPAAYAPHLRKAPLSGVPAKSVIVQFAKGDMGAPNPNTTAILRAGDLADRTLYYRHDLAREAIPALPPNPHPFMVSPNVAAFRDISLAVQAQIAIFFASDGKTIIQPEPAEYFEVPIKGPLPEELNYLP